MNQETFDKICRGEFNDRLFAFMDLVGVECIKVHYSGGGDSGGADNIEYAPDKISKSLKEEIDNVCGEDLSTPIYNKHGSFADGGGYSVDGVVVYDAKRKIVTISGTDHYYEWESNGDEDDEDGEEKCRDEEWYEDVYEQKQHDLYEDEDYTFAAIYAKYVLKKKLPEEFHNRLLLAATDNCPTAKDYIKWAANKK